MIGICDFAEVVQNMTRAMASHHAPQGIRVNCACICIDGRLGRLTDIIPIQVCVRAWFTLQ